MNKKGFTLIEIIVCLALIVGIGTVSIVSINKKDNELKELTQNIVDAANVYINIEKDENGKTYHYGILNGGKSLHTVTKFS